MTQKVTILGARSDIAMACAHAFGQAGHALTLAARDVGTLGDAARDLEIRYGGTVALREFDALAIDDHAAFAADDVLPDVVICAVGLLGDQKADEADSAATRDVLRANFEGPAILLNAYAALMEARGSGTIVGISSVAGDRGRATNYIYGSAKAGFTAFLSGLRNRLARKGVHVVTVKPGFVATRMTQHLDLPGALTAEPAEVGHAVLKAVVKGRDVIYVRAVWRIIMGLIRNIPERVFKKLSI
ncbi:putative oxidoreductase [Pseudooceanicola batsensis HTCC2597]|uniref:Putative oxidoreductase n=1 Tax=Pseudooceanicola batsensis (strain ATCC BAA-863 / DSM 15984 / KCTC 12145 / HTCC2597) TaxID=252305 RepID=A3TVB6_PSEBH|nr:SDR family oxidoreductase [Pseudooceanicola batsensis]EAQ04462.1 putative oxidoreductase [Pseudooceanicola batsensis HTCC2597]